MNTSATCPVCKKVFEITLIPKTQTNKETNIVTVEGIWVKYACTHEIPLLDVSEMRHYITLVDALRNKISKLEEDIRLLQSK